MMHGSSASSRTACRASASESAMYMIAAAILSVGYPKAAADEDRSDSPLDHADLWWTGSLPAEAVIGATMISSAAALLMGNPPTVTSVAGQ